jgi:hypothetical protein
MWGGREEFQFLVIGEAGGERYEIEDSICREKKWNLKNMI